MPSLVGSEMCIRDRCCSRRQVPAPAVLHLCDVPYHSRHLVTPEAWSGGRKPAHCRCSCRSCELADPGTAPGRLGPLTPARRKRRHMARRHIMPYQDAGQQSHQLATWAHSITQGRSPPRHGAHSSPICWYRKAVVNTNFLCGGSYLTVSTLLLARRSGLFHGLVTVK